MSCWFGFPQMSLIISSYLFISFIFYRFLWITMCLIITWSIGLVAWESSLNWLFRQLLFQIEVLMIVILGWVLYLWTIYLQPSLISLIFGWICISMYTYIYKRYGQVLSLLSLAAGCASASLTGRLLRQKELCRHGFCVYCQISAALAIINWFLMVVSALLNVRSLK